MLNRSSFALGALLLFGQKTFAQAAPRLSLGRPTGAVAERFVFARSVRELSDGRVLVSEPGPDSRLVVLDFATARAKSIGRMGRGPEELEHASKLFSAGGDTTIMDAGGRRWLTFVGDRIVATTKPDDPALLAAPSLRGVDRLGRVLTTL